MHISTKCSVAVHCLIFIYEYGEKAKVTSELLSRSTGINPVTIRNIFRALKNEGMISVKVGTGGATLTESPEKINLYRICKAIEPDFLVKLIGVHANPSQLCPVGRNIHGVLEHSYEKIRTDLCATLEKITLRDMITDYEQTKPDAPGL